MTDKEKLEDLRQQVSEMNQRLARMEMEFLSLVQTVQRLVMEGTKVSSQD